MANTAMLDLGGAGADSFSGGGCLAAVSQLGQASVSAAGGVLLGNALTATALRGLGSTFAGGGGVLVVGNSETSLAIDDALFIGNAAVADALQANFSLVNVGGGAVLLHTLFESDAAVLSVAVRG
ncbi:MAG: hypothetical protein KF703_14115, partial [Actinobacteria bacterium]|nr:hypothetical protein [Actinomycetota bacterium]